jgi:hypothetical protein
MTARAADVANALFPPVVGIVASPGAQDACERSGLSLAALLEPFSRVPGPSTRAHTHTCAPVVP